MIVMYSAVQCSVHYQAFWSLRESLQTLRLLSVDAEQAAAEHKHDKTC